MVVVVDGRLEVAMEREEVDGVLDTVAGGTEAPDDIVNNCEQVKCNFFSLVQFVTNHTTSSSEIFEEKTSPHVSSHVKENDTRELHLASAYMDTLEISLGSTGG